MGPFYSVKENREIALHKDACSLRDWFQNKSRREESLCAVHEKGFPVFLSPSEIERQDAYKNEDPYHVEDNLHGPFHQGRLKETLSLLKLCHLSSEPAALLDIGCGEAFFTAEISRQFPALKIHGIDCSIAAIERACQRVPLGHFAVADAYEIPYSDQCFDVILCNNLWEHVPDPLRLLTSLSRVLKSKGYLIISTPSRYRFPNLLNLVRRKPITFMSKFHVTEYSVGQICEQLKFGGYKILKVSSPDIMKHYCSWESRLLFEFAKAVVSLMNPRHVLEPTAFFLAQKEVLRNSL